MPQEQPVAIPPPALTEPPGASVPPLPEPPLASPPGPAIAKAPVVIAGEPIAFVEPPPTVAEPPGDSDEPTAEDLAEAELRIRTYLKVLGLQDGAVQKQVMTAAIEQARQTFGRERGCDCEAGRFAAEAVAAVIDITNHWLDGLARSAGDSSAEAVLARRGQLPWLLRAALQEHPEAFGNCESLPDAVRRAVELSGRAVLPPASPTVMERQQLGNWPRFWLAVAGAWRSAWRRLWPARQGR
jgi:hypothetical protein